MKKLLYTMIVVAFVFPLLVPVLASSADLMWDYSAEDQAAISGFRLLFWDVGNEEEIFSYLVREPEARLIPDMETTLHLLPGHEYNFKLRAWNTEGESADSNIVYFTMPGWVPPDDRFPSGDGKSEPSNLKVQ